MPRKRGTPNLVPIAGRVLLMPRPSSGDYVFELGIFWLPTQFLNGLCCGGDKLWGVPRATRLFHGGNFLAGNLFARLNYLAHRVAVAIAKVVESGFPRC